MSSRKMYTSRAGSGPQRAGTLAISWILALGILPVAVSPASLAAQDKNDEQPGVPSIAPEKIEAPKIASFWLEDARGKPVTAGPGPVYLNWKVKGSRAIQYHYRVSLNPAFPGASWHPVPKGRPMFEFPSGTPPGRTTVHLQLMTEGGAQSVVASADVKYVPRRPDLIPAVTQTPDPVYPGQIVTYTVTVGNRGTGEAENVFVLTRFGDDLEFVSVDDADPPYDPGGGGTRCFNSPDSSNCQIVQIGSGREAWVRIRARLLTSAEPGQPRISTIEADQVEWIEEEDETNNEIEAVVNTTEAPPADHVIDGEVAVQFAMQQGYGFPVEDLQPPSGCQFFDDVSLAEALSSAGAVAGAAVSLQVPNTASVPRARGSLADRAMSALPEIPAGEARCRFTFFAHEELAAPWELTDVELEWGGTPTPASSDTEWVVEPQLGTDDPHFVIEVANGEGTSVVWGVLKSITLTAPQNHGDWQDAFRP